MQLVADKTKKNRFLLGIVLNTLFIIVEVIYGFKANSIALLADAVHNASDVLGLGLVWVSYIMAQRQATHKFTYGFKSATIFAAFLNSIILFLAIGNLLWESLLRLIEPQPVISTMVIWVALLGVLINGTTALLFLKDRKSDLNILSVFLNMALDTLLSVTVVIGGLFIWWRGWFFIDPLLGILIALTIIYSFWGLFKETIKLIFQAVPNKINLHDIIQDIKDIPEVVSYHDLHVWALSTTETALSVHIITKAEYYSSDLSYRLAEIFKDKYNIRHSTIQVEVDSNPQGCTNC